MKCLQCGKGIPEGQKFCSRSCSAKYNNVRRERKPWTEEQREKVRVERHCRYCGSSIQKGFACSDCLPFVHGIPIHKKLDLTSGSLKDRDIEAFNYLSRLYFKENLGIIEISKKTGVRHVSLKSLFRRHGVESMRSISEGLKVAILEGRCNPPETQLGCSGDHTAWNGYKFRYRSRYELRYAQSLDDQKVPYLYENFRIPYFDSVKQKQRIAIPDFYLPESNEIIEIKSKWTIKGKEQELRDKFQEYQKLGYVPKLILEGQEYSAGMV